MKTFYNKNYYNIKKENVGIEERSYNEFSDYEKKLIELAQFDKNYIFEAWTALGTNIELGYSTHGFFRYFGKFPPVISTHLITKYTKENDQVFDPMSGSGTTAVEGMLLNRKTIVNDINPLSVLLAKVKTTHINKKDILTNLNTIKKNYKPICLKEYNYEPVGLKDYNHWFLPETCDSLRGIKKCIEEISSEEIRNFFLACFCAIIRPVSRATTQQGRLFLDVETAKKDALDTFEKKVLKNMDAVDELKKKNKVTVISEDVQNGDFSLLNNSSKLIIMHPPYFNSYKYSSINSLELSWLDINHADIRKSEIREFFKVGKKENVDKYVNDMTSSIINITKTLKKNGYFAIMIGDTIIKDEYVPVTNLLINNIDKSILSIEKIILRVPKYTEASWAASQRRKGNNIGINLYDFIIIFKKVK